METIIARIRLNQRPEDFVDFLNGVFPSLKFTHECADGENVIKCTTELTETARKAVVNKLKLTSVRFVDKDNYMHNY